MAESENETFAKRKIELARLDASEIDPVVQSLTINLEKDLCFLQLTPELLNNVKEGQVLTIRGDLNDQAVLCTEFETYELKEAETSNSLMLTPDLILPEDFEECEEEQIKVIPQEITGIFHQYYELRKMKPSFKKLKILLDKTAFRGKEYETEITEGKLTFADLLNLIQSSEKELKLALQEMHTFVLDGYIRVLDFDYKFNVVSSILNVIESMSLPFDQVEKHVVINSLADLEPRIVLDNCFMWFTKPSECAGEHELYALNEDSICRLYGEFLLRVAGKFHLEDFLESWQKSVPEGLKCALDQLRGLAVADLTSTPAVIFHFPAFELSENITQRFDRLFKVKPKWTYEEIFPYLEDLVEKGNNGKSLLVKYARESTKDGVHVYSSKW